ncbi:hypothetical protein E8E95_12585 [Pseudomonas sp. BN414]|uniref:hypothetical protein n=1 Tax=Pseudomonas sp. BN414 TaxID=2567888 RepID=UPI002458D88F|nr:hypothetical protein [Pseudomonas sp. BN414]MDH4567520.1 hypothetical protein [Pseudomonas sp. BN414]
MHQGIAHMLQAKLCKVLPFCLIQCSVEATGDLTVVAKPFGNDEGWVITGFNANDLTTPDLLDEAASKIIWGIREGLQEM